MPHGLFAGGMMRRMVNFVMGATLLCLGSSALLAKDYSRDVKLGKGKAKVVFSRLAAEGGGTGPNTNPRVGIAPSVTESFGNYLAKTLDESGRVQVVPSSRLAGPTLATGANFDSMMRQDLEAAIQSRCAPARLHYLLLLGHVQPSMKTDVTAYVFGLGRMRMRNHQEARLYDCKTRKVVWHQNVLFETSQHMLSSVVSGNMAGALLGGPEAEKAWRECLQRS